RCGILVKDSPGQSSALWLMAFRHSESRRILVATFRGEKKPKYEHCLMTRNPSKPKPLILFRVFPVLIIIVYAIEKILREMTMKMVIKNFFRG
ncbi:MAG: hypothetical protein AN487_13140, partial [Anabaena sp. CRKS33]